MSLKDINDALVKESKTDSNAKSDLTELRSLPFRCATDRTKYNIYGRISEMYFEQVIDEDILQTIHK